MPFGTNAGRADARRRAPFGLRAADPLAALFAPHILPGRLGALALPAGLGAGSEVHHLFRRRPLLLGGALRILLFGMIRRPNQRA
jgi:hypothetical protein